MREQQDTQASILDRLIDTEPGVSHEPVQRRFATINQVRESVVRDLENLLNTRKSIHAVPEADGHVTASLFTYGVRDFISYSPRSPSVRQQIRQEIERIIVLFEPRIRNVSVRLDTSAGVERTLRFRISGLLAVGSVTAPVTFDTCFDINRGDYFIPK
jgi:type VI secretion system protein ImpF